MNKVVCLIFTAIVCFSGVNAKAAGIPVVDASSIAQDAANFLQTLDHYQKQLMQMKQQYEQQIKEYQSMVDPRGMASAINSMYDNLLKVNTKEVLDSYGILDPSELRITDSSTAESFENATKRASDWLSRVDKFQKQTVDRFDQLQQLVTKVDTTKDPKDVWDLQARIQAEQALLQNETIKQMLIAQEATARKEMEEQKMLQQHYDFVGKEGPSFSFK